MMIVTVPKAWLETCGTGSLEGLLYESGVMVPGPVTLRFEREPITEKGPGLLLSPDFAHVCMAKSLIHLCRQGYEIKIEEDFR